MARILVTGGGGFIGANLAARLVADGHDVHLLVRPGSDPWRLAALEGRVRRHEADVRDRAAVERVCTEVQPQQVFHLAAFGNSSWETDPQLIVDATLTGAIHVIEAAARVGCEAIVQAGSSSEYGFCDHPPVETDRVAPNSVYAVAKAAATLHAQFRARAFGDPVVTLRLYSAYGPWEDPGRLLPTLIVRGRDGEWPPLVHSQIARDFVYVDDVVEACLVAAGVAHAHRGEIFNIGSGVQTTLGDVAALARQALPLTTEPAWGSMDARAWDTARWVSNPRRAAEVLGWRARVPFAEGFRRFVRWFEDDPARVARYRDARV